MKERRFKEPLLDKWERKFGRRAPKNIMLVIVLGTALVWMLDYVVIIRAGVSIRQWLYFDRTAILNGEVWRLLTFIFVSDSGSLFSLALGLYLDWLIGSTLESEWGALKFDVFYLSGILGAILAGFITGYTTNYYLNLSLFLAFALLYPDYQLLLFFFIPIKMKYLAIIYAASIVLIFLTVSTWECIALAMSLVNILIFFSAGLFRKIKNYFRRKKYQREAKIKNNDDYPFDL